MRAKIRAEVHTEYLTLTSVIDLSVDLSDALCKTKEGLRATYTTYAELERNFAELQKGLSGAKTPARSSPEYDAMSTRMRGLHKSLYDDFWNEKFDVKVLDRHGVMSREYLGRRLVDVRGLVTCEAYPADCEETDLDKLGAQPMQLPFYRRDEDGRGAWQRVSCPKEDWARLCLDRAWPFLTAVQENLPGRLEYTASRLLEGRMLYVSALGPQPREGTTGGERPIYFYVHSATQCQRQIGRVVDRLTQLGTLRLASIVALPALKSVSQSIRDVEHTMSGIRTRLRELIQKCNRPTYSSEERSQARQELQEDIVVKFAEVQDKMDLIASGELEANKTLGDESLDYRLSRSRYYRNQFWSLVEGLRILRIEGYQQYDEFVRRRLEGAFGYIDSIEGRLVNIRAEWRALDQLYLTTSITIMTGEIDFEQSQSKALQEQIRNLQAFGEAALLLVLVPYYALALIFKYALHCTDNHNCEHQFVGGLDAEQVWPIIVFTCCAGLFATRNGRELANVFKALGAAVARFYDRWLRFSWWKRRA